MTETALITGASAGLGAELTRLFARDKHDVILVARRRDKLDALAAELTDKHGINAHVIAEDLADRGAPERILAAVRERNLRVDYLSTTPASAPAARSPSSISRASSKRSRST
jgi:short-subunit dehydrogenase